MWVIEETLGFSRVVSDWRSGFRVEPGDGITLVEARCPRRAHRRRADHLRHRHSLHGRSHHL